LFVKNSVNLLYEIYSRKFHNLRQDTGQKLNGYFINGCPCCIKKLLLRAVFLGIFLLFSEDGLYAALQAQNASSGHCLCRAGPGMQRKAVLYITHCQDKYAQGYAVRRISAPAFSAKNDGNSN